MHVVLHLDEWRQIAARGGLGGIADRLRRWLARSIAPGLSGERRSVLEGIVLGEGSSLSPRLRHDFQASGLYHLLAVSGQNVVLVAAGALVLAWLLGLARWIGELGALAGIMAYVLAVGPQPSVIRAGVAGSLASLAWLSGRLRDAWYALLLAAIGLLAWNPYLVYDPGFQLSFAAVAAIFTVVPCDRPPPRGRSAAARSSARGRRVGGLRARHRADSLAAVRVPAAARCSRERAGRAGDAGAPGARVRRPPASRVALPSAAAVVASLNGWVALYIALCAHVIGSLPFAEIKSTRALAGLTAAILLVAVGRRIVRAGPARAP